MKGFPDCTLVVFTLLLACAANPDELRVDRKRECQTAAQLRAPSKAGGPHMGRTLWRVHECPEQAGGIVAELLADTRSEDDTAAVQSATSLAQYIHDARVLAVALALAADSEATIIARLGALRALLWAKAPGHPYHSLAALIGEPECTRPRCFSSYTGHFYGGGPVAGDTISWPAFGRPMPPGYVARIDSTAALIEQAANSPQILRRAARHVRIFPPDLELQGR